MLSFSIDHQRQFFCSKELKNKTVDYSGIHILIFRVEGEHPDHLTTIFFNYFSTFGTIGKLEYDSDVSGIRTWIVGEDGEYVDHYTTVC